MALVDNDMLAEMTDIVAEDIAEFRNAIETEAHGPAEPGDLFELELMESIYSCLWELAQWRAQFPDKRMVPVYTTAFGDQVLQ